MTTPLIIELVLEVGTIPGLAYGRPRQTPIIDLKARFVPATSCMPVPGAG